MWNFDDLIIAPATVRAGGGRAVVRLAGDELGGLLDRLFLPAGGAWPEAAGVVAARFGDAQLTSSYGPLAVEVLFWPGPSGPIGGPLAEVQLPGCVPLVDALVARAVDLGARLARGGEFTLRAFLAGRIDLVQAEAVLSVVDARSPDELSEALDRMAGGLGGGLDAVRGTLLDLAGDIEAMIDFGEDAIGAVAMRDHLGSLAARTHAAAGSLDAVAGRLASRSAGAAERPRVVFCGPPNIGKSSLFNRLLGAAAALVADEPGTTRDWLEARYEVEGVECTLIDVAGIAPEGTTADGMTRASGEAAARQMAAADVLVVCTDATADAASSMPSASRAVRRIDVRTRCDRLPAFGPLPEGVIATSAIDGTGIDGLRRAIARAAAEAAGSPSYATVRLAEGVARARASLGEAAAELERAGESVDEAVVASHVGRAVAAIGEVTGREIGNDILDRIFSRHCIGK